MSRKKTIVSLKLILLLTMFLGFGNISTVFASHDDHLREVYNPKDYGAKGDGITDDTEAVRAAISSAEQKGGTVYIPEGNFLLKGNGTELLKITKQIHLKGAGFRSRLLIDGSVPTTTDVIRISPGETAAGGVDPNHSKGWEYTIDGIMIQPKIFTHPVARHAIHIDVSKPGQIMARMMIGNNFIAGFGGNGIFLSNPVNNDGYFTSTIQNNAINNGINLQRAGDSINIFGNTITGVGTGIDLKLVEGATHVVIAYNNFTSRVGSIRITSGRSIKVLYNTMEQQVPYAGPDNAIVTIEGTPQSPVLFTEIVGNKLSGSITRVENLIKLNHANYTKIRSNWLVRGTKALINILPEANFTEIDEDNVLSEDALGAVLIPRSKAIEDAGTGTVGVRKNLILNSTWSNFNDVTHQKASVIRDTGGVVNLSGVIKKTGEPVIGEVIFTLPEHYRPFISEVFTISANVEGMLYLVQLQVDPNGDIKYAAGDKKFNQKGDSGFISLSGISFSIYN